jgi:hypothetical protein
MDARKYHRTWYATKTLLGGEPDTNRLRLYIGDEKVWEWNIEMAPWSPLRDQALNEAIAALNRVEEINGQ